MAGLLLGLERKTGWRLLTEHAEEATPDRMWRLFAAAWWDDELVRYDVRGYMVSALSDPGGVVIGDDTELRNASPLCHPRHAGPGLTVRHPRRTGGTPRRQSKASGRLTTSANEIRRLFAALYWPPPDEEHTRHCSQWRHRHQQHAVIAIINYNASKSTKRCGSTRRTAGAWETASDATAVLRGHRRAEASATPPEAL